MNHRMSKTKKVDLNKIRLLRKQKKLSLQDMSDILGYKTPNGYYYLEVGRCVFPADKLAKVADTLDICMNDLFFED